MKDLCFIDIETTGAIFGWHEIIEIGAIKTSPDAAKILDKYERRIKPKHPERLTCMAREINNYSEEQWEDAENPSQVLWESAIAFWKNCMPICHNPSFERAFITLACLGFHIQDTGLGYHWIGTESISWPLYSSGKTSKLSLSYLTSYFGLDKEPLPHKAINGASLCREVYLKLMS